MAHDEIDATIERLLGLRSYALELARGYAHAFADLPDESRASAQNLLHYLALRRHDLRPLQEELWRRGLSSLGRAEAHVLANLDAVLDAAHRIAGRRFAAAGGDDAQALGFDEGRAILERRADRTLGPLSGDRATRVMVTMPYEAAVDPQVVAKLVARGMDLVRINTAHDGPDTWRRIVEHVRAAERDAGRRVGIAFDLAGPKLRTGALVAGPRVVRFKPQRDAMGRVLGLAEIRFTPPGAHAEPRGGLDVPLAGDGLEAVRAGDTLLLVDGRGRKRRLSVTKVVGGALEATADRTGYLTPGLEIEARRKNKVVGREAIGALPPTESVILLSPGDLLILTRDDTPGEGAKVDPSGRVLSPAHVPCPVPEVFRDVRPGQRILFDDGEITGLVQEVGEEGLHVTILRTARGTAKLRAEKGINLPDTQLDIPALTPEDLDHLAFVAEHADLVSLSFVQRAEDVHALVRRLRDMGRPHVGIVLKIETERAFRRLPQLLLAALAHPRVAVMVARGDLAVEVGFERLAELQEEILWLCEAAHVPTIWATQVLESLAKTGVPSRAEVTDAVASTRAECVMLNKGPHVDEAVEFLVDVIARARGHQEKKRPMLRRLRVADFDVV